MAAVVPDVAEPHPARRLILIKHAMPIVDAAVPAKDWRLGEFGRSACKSLAKAIARWNPATVVSSEEPKAVETSELVARELGLDSRPCAGLQETDRTGVPLMGKSEFEAAVCTYFEQPGDRVLGNESADEAHHRFARAVASLIAVHREPVVAVVAHGTVISSMVSRANGIDPFQFWRRLGLPSYCVLSIPDYALVETVERIETRT